MRHKCDETCVCPIHRTPLWFAPKTGEHACQDINCVHGHGLRTELLAPRAYPPHPPR